MNEILVITNNASDAQLVNLAYQFAYQNGSHLTVANVGQPQLTPQLAPALPAEKVKAPQAAQYQTEASGNELRDINGDSFLLRVNTFDASRLTESELAAHIWKKGYSLVIGRLETTRLDLQCLLNKLNCPLILLPANINLMEINRVVYLTDIRFCQQLVLTQLAKLKRDSLLIAHICQQGLPDLTLPHGKELFADTVKFYHSHSELFFSHIRERNFHKIADTLIGTMRADMLVCQNRQYHFQQILGDRLPNRLPSFISVPLLIFPS